jgi:long-subunit fatty acid transport protein
MLKHILTIVTLTGGLVLQAQTPEDALRYSWLTHSGTARNMATGGVMGSLGGDITANNVNPAGLGLFKTSEFVLSPGLLMHQNKFNFRGTNSQSDKNAFNLGASGFIFGIPHGKDNKWTSSAFSISFNQLANFNNRTYYKGLNNTSSFSEQYLEELIRDRADTNAALSNYIFGSSLAYRTYLIDKQTGPGGALTGFESLVPITTGVIQERDERTSGSFNELSFGFANNLRDKLYLGGSINMPLIRYRRELFYKESDATSNINNDFNYMEFRENNSSNGLGLNMKLGMIYKPQEFIRLGFAFHTPSAIAFKDDVRAWMKTDTEGYAGVTEESSDALNSGNAGTREYNMITPWRAIVSGSYVFREIKDTRKQRAFVSADIEYVNHRGARFMATDNQDQTAENYYDGVNQTIKDYYRGAFNFRLGGELKLHTWMFRAGAAYYGNPYEDKENLKANRFLASGGIGYRNYGMFIDLSYAHSFNNDVQFPYRLNDKPNTFAEQTGSRGNVMMTVGFKF